MTDSVDAINRGGSIALLSADLIVPITNWLDVFGEECDPDDAVSCVAGPDESGYWYAIDLTQFPAATVH